MFKLLAALPLPKTLAKNRLAAIVFAPCISCFGTERQASVRTLGKSIGELTSRKVSQVDEHVENSDNSK